MDELFLGLDCSTQGLTAIAIDFNAKKVTWKESINFDADLKSYGTKNGVYVSNNGKKVFSNPLMWIDAVDYLFAKLKSKNFPFNKILALSGSAQQHGTVYVNEKFEKVLASLNTNESMAEQLNDAFSREIAPVWMDSSTTMECSEIRKSLGGKKNAIKITGSDIFERFSAPQIKKFYIEEPSKYENTRTIHLVSSFLASIFIGKNAPIDHADGSGMNLMNIKTRKWDARAVKATAPNLLENLPPLCPSERILGKINPYFVKKYGFSPNTLVIAWSGDNPNSLIGIGLVKERHAAMSLGTSDTYFNYMKKLFYDFKGEGHVFVAPTGDYMSLICYKNGSLAREIVKNKFNLSWQEFSEILNTTAPGNNGNIMLPYFFPEIVPFVPNPKVYRFGFDEDDMESNVRGIIEAQFLSMKLHSKWIKEKPIKIMATGGASCNEAILQVAADIFQAIIYKFEITNSAALGASLRSAKSYYDQVKGTHAWFDYINKFMNEQDFSVIKPRKEFRKVYSKMLKKYEKFEKSVLYK